jgi:hypothetical protein
MYEYILFILFCLVSNLVTPLLILVLQSIKSSYIRLAEVSIHIMDVCMVCMHHAVGVERGGGSG